MTEYPRVTPKDVDESVQAAEYTTHGTLTICVLTMRNGFKLTGESACAHPMLYDKEMGETLALKKAKDKIWPLLGYALRQRLHEEENSNFVVRLRSEHAQLSDRLGRLQSFLGSEAAMGLPEVDRTDLRNQASMMNGYLIVLARRLARHDPYVGRTEPSC